MAAQNNDDEELTQINVTPFVDVVLVLFVIFMVAAPLITPLGHPVGLSLPQGQGSETAQKAVVLALDAQGKGWWEGKEISQDQLSMKIHEEKKKIMIAADKNLTHGKVMGWMEALRKLGVTDVSMGVTPSGDG